jgi:hypothetical protein
MRKVSNAARLLAAILVIGWAVPAVAQPQPLARPAAAQPLPPVEPVEDLPVSLDRIRAKLAAQPRTAESTDGLRLSYYVDVFGVAPQLDIFGPDINLTTAPVQYGGMTHREFLDHVTPQEFKSPVADIPSALAALIKWATEKRKNGSDQR